MSTLLNSFLSYPPDGPSGPSYTTGLLCRLTSTVYAQDSSLTWDDQSGNGNHFVAPSAGTFPAFTSGYARFDGPSRGDRVIAGDFLTGKTSGEIFIRTGIPVSGGNSAGGDFGSDAQGDWQNLGGTFYDSFGSTTRRSGTVGVSHGNWYTIGTWSASNDWAYRVDGTSKTTSGSNTVGWSTAPTLGYMVHSSSFANNYIAEVLIYDHKLGSTDRTSVESYLSTLVSGSTPT